MLRQIGRRGHLIALIKDEAASSGGTPSHKVFELLAGEITSRFSHGTFLLSREAAELLAKGKHIPDRDYLLMFALLQQRGVPVQHKDNRLYSSGALVLPPMALPLDHLKYSAFSLSTYNAHMGNSSVVFRGNDQAHVTGFIQ
jgi:hypothetical protein